MFDADLLDDDEDRFICHREDDLIELPEASNGEGMSGTAGTINGDDGFGSKERER